MNVVLPRASRGALYPRLIPIEFNNFDVERVLPTLYYLVVTRGHTRAHRPNDPKAIERYVDALVANPKVQGFDDAEGRRLLDQWLRAEVVTVSRVGKSRVLEQIDYLVPQTVLVHKTGLPQEISKQRNVHTFVYNAMVNSIARSSTPAEAKDVVRRVVSTALGQGVTLDPGPAFDGRYDESTEVDITGLLAMRYLEAFVPTRAALERAETPIAGPVLPHYEANLGRDLLAYLIAYAGALPPAGIVGSLMALIGFELFAYSVKLSYATNAFLRTGTTPRAMSLDPGRTPPEIYCDFTHEPRRTSDEMARACVDRDLEELGVFYDSLITLRTLDRFAEMAPEARPLLESHMTDSPEYLSALWSLRTHPSIVSRGHMEIEAIEAETLGERPDPSVASEFQVSVARLLAADGANHFTVAARLTADAQRKNVMSNMVKWFWSSGGLRVPYGILTGNVTGPRNWRYQISDDLLAALVQLAFLESRPGVGAQIRPRIRLCEFLEFLEDRFGVIVDRPPAFVDSAITRATARSNLEAMKRRLRQMGYYLQLSDDYNAQYLTAPYGGLPIS